jgi:ankyrin repeat protein/L-ascorbate metabolism protein UlaG (beta-lactamase superfamily)
MCNIRVKVLALLMLLVFMLSGLAWSVDINVKFKEAIQKGDMELVKKILIKRPELATSSIDDKGFTALHAAAARSRKNLVAFFLKKGADTNVQTTEGKYTPMHYAALGGDVAIVKMLLAKGAKVDLREMKNRTPLYFAAYRGHLDVVKLLLKKGAKLIGEETKTKDSPLKYAVHGNHLDVAKFLLSQGAEIPKNPEDGYTLLHHSAWSGSKELISFLIDNGIPANSTSKNGRTPLQNAARNNTGEVVSLLLNRGANVNAKNENKKTALYFAAVIGNKENVAILLKAGATVDYQDNKTGRSLLHFTAIKGFGKITKMLLTKGADANGKDKSGKTPLYYAARYGQGKVAKLLLASGASKDNFKNNFGFSPLLKKQLKSGDALIWYLGHSGWAIKTDKHFLVFDYYKTKNRADTPLLANGSINPEEIKGLDTYVFSSHSHDDHYMPEIFDWKKIDPKITYVMGFEPKDKKDYVYLPPRKQKKVGDIEVTTIKSNDLGVGFVVKVDGLTIYHPGDHANRKNDFSGPFKEEIEYLAAKNLKPDLMFSPLVGCGATDQGSVKKGLYYTVKKLSPQVVFPMHAIGQEHRYRTFADEVMEKGLKTPILCADNTGDYFFYSQGKAKYAQSHAPFNSKEEKMAAKLKKNKKSSCNSK